jgi:serine/threonine protein kinase
MVSSAGYPQGVLLQNRYRVISQVGTGGFGVVYKAVDTQHTERLVAIKAINLRGLRPQAVIPSTASIR